MERDECIELERKNQVQQQGVSILQSQGDVRQLQMVQAKGAADFQGQGLRKKVDEEAACSLCEAGMVFKAWLRGRLDCCYLQLLLMTIIDFIINYRLRKFVRMRSLIRFIAILAYFLLV